LERLKRRGRQAGQTLSQVAKTLLEEGLRLEGHPGIVFRDGAAGRRPGLTGGPDVWEVARVIRDTDAGGDEAVRRVARLTALTPTQVRAALDYYAEYGDEVDDWIRGVDDDAERAEATWRRRHSILE